MQDEGGARNRVSRASRQDQSRERIYRVAAKLIAQRGITNFSTDEVAARAGCSRATLYRYVGGKSAIVDGLVSRATYSLHQQIRQAVAGLHGPDRVVEMILAAVAATRAESLTVQVLDHASATNIRAHLDSRRVWKAALVLAGLHPDDHAAGLALVRIIWSLVQQPLCNSDSERALIERFVKPAFENYSYPGQPPTPSRSPTGNTVSR
jgi:AcrR family transcriptional regulator